MSIGSGKVFIYFLDLRIMNNAFCSHTTNTGNEPDDNQLTCSLVVNTVNAARLYGVLSAARAAFRETRLVMLRLLIRYRRRHRSL